MKLSNAIDEFYWAKKAQNYSKVTVENYKYTLGPFSDLIGDIEITELRPYHIRKYVANELGRQVNGHPIATQSVATRFSMLRAFCNWLKEQEIVAVSPAKGVKPPLVNETDLKILNDENIRKIFRVLSDIGNFRNTVILEVFLSTGIRLNELVQIEIEHLDFNDRLLTVHGKGRRIGRVPLEPSLSRDLLKYINKYRKAAPGIKALFVTKEGFPVSRSGVISMIRRTFDRAGITQKVGAHLLRHTFATNFLRNGGNQESLRKILRHSSLKTTQRYLHLNDQDVLEEHLKVSPLLKMQKRRLL